MKIAISTDEGTGREDFSNFFGNVIYNLIMRNEEKERGKK